MTSQSGTSTRGNVASQRDRLAAALREIDEDWNGYTDQADALIALGVRVVDQPFHWCSYCGESIDLTARKRSPMSNRLAYCEACKARNIPARERVRRYRERKKLS